MKNALIFVLLILVVGGAFIIGKLSNNDPEVPIKTEVAESRASTVEAETVPKNEFYTQAASNVRSCASLSCEPIGVHPINHRISLPYKSVADMPDWVPTSVSGVDEMQQGFISKTLLGESKAVIPTPANPPVNKQQSQPSDKQSFYGTVNNIHIITNSVISSINTAMEEVAIGDTVSAEDSLGRAHSGVDIALSEYENTLKNKYSNMPPEFNTAEVCVGARIGYAYNLISELHELMAANAIQNQSAVNYHLQRVSIHVEDIDFAESCINDFLSEHNY